MVAETWSVRRSVADDCGTVENLPQTCNPWDLKSLEVNQFSVSTCLSQHGLRRQYSSLLAAEGCRPS